MKKFLEPAQPQEMELIEAYLEHLRRGGCTKATLDGRGEILGRLNRDLPYGIGVASSEDLARWLYRDEWSQNTKATYYRAIKSFYTWAADPADPWLSDNPALDLETVNTKRGVARPVTDEQLARILSEAPEPILTWSKLAAYQGLRCIEISRLNREHVTEQSLYVVEGKGGHPRVHDTDPYIWEALQGRPRGPIAVDPDGARADRFYVSMTAAHFFRRKLHMPGVGLHRLRHWLGVNLQARYRDIRVTQAALGHLSLSSTQIYTAATDEQQRAARATLPRLAG